MEKDNMKRLRDCIGFILDRLIKLLKVINAFLACIVVALITSILTGTILYLLWPVVVVNLFPDLVSSGIISGNPSWWGCVCIMLLFWTVWNVKIAPNTTQ